MVTSAVAVGAGIMFSAPTSHARDHATEPPEHAAPHHQSEQTAGSAQPTLLERLRFSLTRSRSSRGEHVARADTVGRTRDAVHDSPMEPHTAGSMVDPHDKDLQTPRTHPNTFGPSLTNKEELPQIY